MRNDRFYKHRRFSKKKRDNKSKNTTSFNSYRQKYSLENLLSDVGNQEVANFFESGLVQAKLNVSQPGDIYEQEADRIAKNIVNSNTTQRPNISHMQPKPSSNNLSLQGSSESKIKNLKGKGKPLYKSVREYFEPRFGIDLGNVRVHTGNEANQLANRMNAKAFTFGNDIAFGQGQYQPETTSGKELIAHELTHTIQQDGGQSGMVQRDANDDIIKINLDLFIDRTSDLVNQDLLNKIYIFINDYGITKFPIFEGNTYKDDWNEQYNASLRILQNLLTSKVNSLAEIDSLIDQISTTLREIEIPPELINEQIEELRSKQSYHSTLFYVLGKNYSLDNIDGLSSSLMLELLEKYVAPEISPWKNAVSIFTSMMTTFDYLLDHETEIIELQMLENRIQNYKSECEEAINNLNELEEEIYKINLWLIDLYLYNACTYYASSRNLMNHNIIESTYSTDVSIRSILNGITDKIEFLKDEESFLFSSKPYRSSFEEPFSSSLSLFDNSKEVGLLQYLYNHWAAENNEMEIASDDYYGPITKSAIERFQLACFKQDEFVAGIADAKTINKLVELFVYSTTFVSPFYRTISYDENKPQAKWMYGEDVLEFQILYNKWAGAQILSEDGDKEPGNGEYEDFGFGPLSRDAALDFQGKNQTIVGIKDGEVGPWTSKLLILRTFFQFN